MLGRAATMMQFMMLPRTRRRAVPALFLASTFACGCVAATAPAPADTTDASPLPSAPACALANTAAPAEARLLGEDAPARIGGSLVDGLYGLTDATTYTGQGGLSAPIGTLQETLRVSDGGSSFAIVSTNTYPENVIVIGTWVTKGEALTTTTVCGPGLTVNELTATPTTIILADTSRPQPMLSTYTRIQ